MSEELMITKEDLINWLDRPPSNDDLDLIGFITTRLENFYKLEQENKQLKGDIKELFKENENKEKVIIVQDNIIKEARKYCKTMYTYGIKNNSQQRNELLEILGVKK